MSKIYVGMSGGVDSSVAAALLKEQGHEVTGVYMKNWTKDLPGMKCPWAEDLADAKRVAVQLDIPFKVFDFQAEYKQKVVDYMISEYAAGRTPNPDIMCNQEVKFKIFLEAALEDGAEFIATGHYARVWNAKQNAQPEPSFPEDPFRSQAAHSTTPRGEGESTENEILAGHSVLRGTQSDLQTSEGARLLTGIDANKDQSYFLYRVTSQALAKTLMPIGEYHKPQIRELAAKYGLITADKKDSQGICFVGKVGIKDFLSQYVQTQPGDVVEYGTDKVIGQHEGAIFYTIGQRHGLGIGGGLPYYVTSKDMQKNIVYATKKIDEDALWTSELRLNSLHWINQPPEVGQTYDIRSRYRAKLIKATLKSISQHEAVLQLENSERAITPGQSTVFYAGDEVLGGGIVI